MQEKKIQIKQWIDEINIEFLIDLIYGFVKSAKEKSRE